MDNRLQVDRNLAVVGNLVVVDNLVVVGNLVVVDKAEDILDLAAHYYCNNFVQEQSPEYHANRQESVPVSG